MPDGFRTLTPRCEPVVQVLRARQRGEKLCQGDETRGPVCAELEGTGGHRWSLGVPRSPSVVCCHRAPRRGAAVPQTPLAKLHKDLGGVGVVWDRESASPSLAQAQDDRIVASGGAHVRRAVRNAARRWPALAPWRGQWMEDSRTLDRLHTARLAVGDAPVPRDAPAPALVARQHALTPHLGERQDRGERDRRERHLHEAQRQSRESLPHPGEGLTVVVGRPEVARDHTAAARALRTPVVGRKHSAGSGSLGRAPLAALRLSVLHPLSVGGLHPRHGLSAFFDACAAPSGKTPPDLCVFLPWPRTDERKPQLAPPLPGHRPPWDRLPPARDTPVVAHPSSCLRRGVS
ncbi:MAG: IS66 family transposase [Thermoleophilia bacterium]